MEEFATRSILLAARRSFKDQKDLKLLEDHRALIAASAPVYNVVDLSTWLWSRKATIRISVCKKNRRSRYWDKDIYYKVTVCRKGKVKISSCSEKLETAIGLAIDIANKEWKLEPTKEKDNT